MGKRAINQLGKRYGKLKVIKELEKNKYRCMMWLCKCDCGKETITTTSHLRSGDTKSCGCGKGNYKHGLRKHRLYIIYNLIKQRCNNSNSTEYKNYGSRGIKNEWNNIEDFVRDMKTEYDKHVKKHGKKNTSIDRINNDGNYCKDNCKWATKEEQANNTRRNKFLTYKGITKTIAQWEKIYNFKQDVLRRRIMRGWNVKRAIEEPIHNNAGIK